MFNLEPQTNKISIASIKVTNTINWITSSVKLILADKKRSFIFGAIGLLVLLLASIIIAVVGSVMLIGIVFMDAPDAYERYGRGLIISFVIFSLVSYILSFCLTSWLYRIFTNYVIKKDSLDLHNLMIDFSRKNMLKILLYLIINIILELILVLPIGLIAYILTFISMNLASFINLVLAFIILTPLYIISLIFIIMMQKHDLSLIDAVRLEIKAAYLNILPLISFIFILLAFILVLTIIIAIPVMIIGYISSFLALLISIVVAIPIALLVLTFTYSILHQMIRSVIIDRVE